MPAEPSSWFRKYIYSMTVYRGLANLSPKKVMFEVPAAGQPSCGQLEMEAGELPLVFQEDIVFQQELNKTATGEGQTKTRVNPPVA